MGVYDELAKLDSESPPQTTGKLVYKLSPTKKKLKSKKTIQQKRTIVRSNERSNVRTVVRNKERLKVRHTFDIFQDQLRELHTRQLKAVRDGEKKPKLGELVQQALDLYIGNKNPTERYGINNDQTNDKTNERSNERTTGQI